MIKLIEQQGISKQMPTFTVFSRLNKDLFKYLLLKITEVDEDMIPKYHKKYLQCVMIPIDYTRIKHEHDLAKKKN